MSNDKRKPKRTGNLYAVQNSSNNRPGSMSSSSSNRGTKRRSDGPGRSSLDASQKPRSASKATSMDEMQARRDALVRRAEADRRVEARKKALAQRRAEEARMAELDKREHLVRTADLARKEEKKRMSQEMLRGTLAESDLPRNKKKRNSAAGGNFRNDSKSRKKANNSTSSRGRAQYSKKELKKASRESLRRERNDRNRAKKVKKPKKVVKFKRSTKFFSVFLALCLVYILAFAYVVTQKTHIKSYEVENGSLIDNVTFTGLALRDEEVVTSEYSGFIDYYRKDDSRVCVGNTVYTVDETGKVTEILDEYNRTGENTITKEDLSDLRAMLNNYKANYDGANFSEIYDLKAGLNTTILHSLNEGVINNLDQILKKSGNANAFKVVNSKSEGIITYYTDGFEGKATTDLIQADFNKENYHKNQMKSSREIASGDAVYKLIKSDLWHIVIPLNKDEILKYNLENATTVDVNLKKENLDVKGDFKLINIDGKSYGDITLSKYMIRYASDRFVDIMISKSGKTGMKIPQSAVTEEEFYVIPKAYKTSGGGSNDLGFTVQYYDSNGMPKTSFMSTEIYGQDSEDANGNYYVLKSDLPSDASLLMMDSNQSIRLKDTVKLKGVYVINSGYTNFKLINTVDANNEYLISEPIGYSFATHYVSLYDRLILDAYKYQNGVFVY